MIEKNTLFVRLADNAMIMSTLRTVNDKTECATAQMTKKEDKTTDDKTKDGSSYCTTADWKL